MIDFVIVEKILKAGFSILPCDSSKKPTIPAWKHLQKAPMKPEDACREFAKATCIALIGGSVSGNLECIDFDEPEVFQPFCDLLEMRCSGLLARLLQRKTPSGGYHIVYRCESPVDGNQKLAMRPYLNDEGKPCEDVLIETRGEGGYFLAPPSPGYSVLSGKLFNCPTITANERQCILETARAFDLRQQRYDTHSSSQASSSDKPGTIFNRNHKPREILEAHGWREDKPTTAGVGYTRPGKESGTSGVLLDSTGNFYCFSSNGFPLEVGRSYDAFGLYAAFNHSGDLSKAAKELAKEFGLQPKDTWKEVDDLWSPSLPEWPVMDQRAYQPGIIADFIELATRKSEADPAAILATFLTRLGVEVGPNIYLEVGDTRHKARLATVIVGQSSKARKGTSGKPVAKLFSLAEITCNMPGMDIYNSARESKGPFSSGEGIIYAIRDPEEKWDAKKQEMVVVDPGVSDKRLFVLDEEFAGVMANTKREGNTLSMIIRQAWDSGNFDPLTKNNKTKATGGHVGWTSHITQTELLAKLGESEGFNGFANRILWVCAIRPKLVPEPEPMAEIELHGIKEKLAAILSKIHGKEILFSLSNEAKNAWREHYYAELTKDRPGLIGCIVSRGEAQVLRLAMLYAILDGQTSISLNNLEAGIAFWNYCKQSAEYIFHGRQSDTTAQTILEALQNESPMTGKEIHGLFNNNLSKERIESAIAELVASGQVRIEKQPPTTKHGGRPTSLYYYSEPSYEKNELTKKPDMETGGKFVNSFNSLAGYENAEVF